MRVSGEVSEQQQVRMGRQSRQLAMAGRLSRSQSSGRVQPGDCLRQHTVSKPAPGQLTVPASRSNTRGAPLTTPPVSTCTGGSQQALLGMCGSALLLHARQEDIGGGRPSHAGRLTNTAAAKKNGTAP